jgi:hypothetical protein
VDASQAPWVEALAGKDAVVSAGPDGEAHFRLAVTNRSALRGFVLGLLDHALVLGPPEVRDEIVEWLERVAVQGP